MKRIEMRYLFCAVIGAGVAITTMPYLGVFGFILACVVVVGAYHMTH